MARRSLAALCGMAVPIVMWTAFVTFGLSRPGFNLLTRPASLLGQVGSPNDGVFNFAYFVLPGLLTMLFAGGLYRTDAHWWSGRVGAGLIGLAGLSLMLSGLVTMNPLSPSLTGVHSAMGLPLLVGIPPALFVVGHALGGNHRWRRYARTSTAIALATGVLVAVYVVLPKESTVDGLFQRTYLALLTPWFIVMGCWLLNSS
jgi:hypothetical membrane protein